MFRSRRRASDGCTGQQHNEIANLQSELKHLCVSSSSSSPPSLQVIHIDICFCHIYYYYYYLLFQTSPIHNPHISSHPTSHSCTHSPLHQLAEHPLSECPQLTLTDCEGEPIIAPPEQFNFDSFVFEANEAKKLNLDLLMNLNNVSIEFRWINDGTKLLLTRKSGDSLLYHEIVMNMIAQS